MTETSKKAYALRKIRKLSVKFADEVSEHGNTHNAKIIKEELKQLIRDYALTYYESDCVVYLIGYTSPEINRGQKFLVQFEIRDKDNNNLISKIVDVVDYDYQPQYTIF